MKIAFTNMSFWWEHLRLDQMKFFIAWAENAIMDITNYFIPDVLTY